MFCPFCGEYYKQANSVISDRCLRCGYDLTLAVNTLLPAKIVIEVSFDSFANIKRVAFAGEELYHTWQQMVLCGRRGRLFYAVDADELSVCSFLGPVMANMQPFAPNTAPGHYTRLVFYQEMTCEETNRHTGCCAWTTRLCRIGVFHLEALTSQERTLFIKWLFATEPQVSAEGRLQFDLSIKAQPGGQ